MLQSLLPRSPITNAANSDAPPMSRPKRSADARDLTPSSSAAAAAAADAAADDDDDRLRKRKQLQLYPQPQQHVVVDVIQERKNDNDYFSGGSSSSSSSAVESRVLRLLGLLLHCAEAVAADRLAEARDILPEINELASPYGSSPERVAAYFADALGARILSSYLGVYSPLLDHHKPLITSHHNRIFNAFQVYNSISPLVKFSHFTANQAIFQALEGEDRVHIVDLDIMQGLQWPGLFQILASRPLKLRSLRITGLGSSLELLEATGRRLSDFAAALGLPFEFQPLEGKIGDQSKPAGGGGGGALARRDGREVAVVHWTHHCLYDVAGSDEAAVSVIKNVIRPRLVTVVEQDLGRHGGDFLGRFVEALHYYSAVFDALGEEEAEAEAETEAERHDVERQLLGAEIRNIVAVGGPKRTGEVAVGRWGEEMRRAGFQQVSLAGGPAAAQANLLLGMRLPWKGYTLVEEAGCLKLGWKDLSLLTASAWKTPEGGREDRDHVQPHHHQQQQQQHSSLST